MSGFYLLSCVLASNPQRNLAWPASSGTGCSEYSAPADTIGRLVWSANQGIGRRENPRLPTYAEFINRVDPAKNATDHGATESDISDDQYSSEETDYVSDDWE